MTRKCRIRDLGQFIGLSKSILTKNVRRNWFDFRKKNDIS